jgi:8-oxo-dGTP pyrophosphatase MutT (NUDIX family)
VTAFDLPQHVMLPVNTVDVRLAAGSHPFEAGRTEAIAANWAAEKALQPALFDGPIMLLASLAYRDGRLEGRCHLVRYSTFLFWRSMRPIGSAGHAFAHAALVSSDDALVAIRMGASTVNAGAVYFAAGSFEPEDFREGRADLLFNMRREVREETGLDIAALRRDESMIAYSNARGTAIFQRFYLESTADEAAERIRAHVAAEAQPEIEGPVVIRRGDAPPDGLAEHMAAFSRWHFEESAT